ncbi:MAG: hypothetical protein JWM40_1688, partial [Frankiales bacterium]|nr:hypothetical protein [Frankiales bacterium]
MSPVAALAARARMTEGQLYSVAITLAVAVLLSLGLGDVHGVAGSAFAEPPVSEPVATLPPVVVPTAAPTPAAPLLPSPSTEGPLPSFSAEPEPEAQPPADPPSVLPSPSPSAAPPCDLQGVSDTGTGLVTTLDGLTGGA